MCDTLCVLSEFSLDGQAYFAKNSDRSPNEPHLVLHVPKAYHASDATVKCTYISIPQAEYTRETILFKPSWIWGAEMGVNSSRVAIGNEAVFTKAKRGEEALTGMDLLRLALERADTAAEAVAVLIELLEKYGQGGNCGFDHDFYYDNSFLVSDPRESYVMETSGKKYAVLKVDDRYAISNRLGIRKNHSERLGLSEGEDFAGKFTEPIYSHFSGAEHRRKQVIEKLGRETDAAGLFSILRGHDAKFSGKEFSRGSVGSVCMHAGGLVGDHTTGSLAAVLRAEKPVTLWVTGASTPCISAFKPVFWGLGDSFEENVAPVFAEPSQSERYWLRREMLHRAAIAGKVDISLLRARINELEEDWLKREHELMSAEIPDKSRLIALSREAAGQEDALIGEFSAPDWIDIRGKGRYKKYWRGKNAQLIQNQAHKP